MNTNPLKATTPVEIKRVTSEGGEGLGLAIIWSDTSSFELPSASLRKNCPCASCKELRGDASHAKPLSGGRSLLRVIKSTTDEETNLLKVSAIGNYAVGLVWGDGHDSGIFTYQHLKELCDEEGKS